MLSINEKRPQMCPLMGQSVSDVLISRKSEKEELPDNESNVDPSRDKTRCLPLHHQGRPVRLLDKNPTLQSMCFSNHKSGHESRNHNKHDTKLTMYLNLRLCEQLRKANESSRNCLVSCGTDFAHTVYEYTQGSVAKMQGYREARKITKKQISRLTPQRWI